MKVLIAPDKFKGSLTAREAGEAMTRGVKAVWPEAEVDLAPMADGGEGFAEALCVAMGGEWIETRAQDPIGREVAARYVWIAEKKLAVLEMSEASGLWRLRADERAPLRATTYGTGQLMRHAIERGALTILVGLGGSATTDGGVGMARALGYEFFGTNGQTLGSIPGDLPKLSRISQPERQEWPEIVAACDVQSPLLGNRGTAQLFSPQKGASPGTVVQLEAAMTHLADVVARDLGCDFREAAGAGAAGGIGFGLLSFCQGQIRSGFEVVADAIDLEKRIAESDLVLTGEGRMDEQTLEGKGPAGVAALARQLGRPVVALAGSIAADSPVPRLFDGSLAIVDEPITLPDAMRRAGEFLQRATQRAAQLIQLGTKL
jgi:glycerate 2-kinase